MLQQQYTGANATAPKILQVVGRVHVHPDDPKTGAARIVATRRSLNGAAADPAASYRVTVNNFLAGGGDGFADLTGAPTR